MIKPITELGRVPEQGRIRIGMKGPKGEPRSITKFRFTSPDEKAIHEVASVYGGTVSPWNGGPNKNQFEVITNASEIRIILPPDPLAGSPMYELWGGKGRLRTCDGVTAFVAQATPDGATEMEVPCLCEKGHKLECTTVTRLRVILPEVRFGGVWRLESKGEIAANELPGMVSTIQALQMKGVMHRAVLAVEQRSAKGGSKKFVVPVLRLDQSPDEMLGQPKALPNVCSAAPPELEA